MDLTLRKFIKSIKFVTHFRGGPEFLFLDSDWSRALDSTPYWLSNLDSILQCENDQKVLRKQEKALDTFNRELEVR